MPNFRIAFARRNTFVHPVTDISDSQHAQVFEVFLELWIWVSLIEPRRLGLYSQQLQNQLRQSGN